MSRSGELGADMRRRQFITVACGAVVWPLTATGGSSNYRSLASFTLLQRARQSDSLTRFDTA